ncbi:MAG: ferredoxin domain-containing protein [Methanocorpusculum sp.]|nr:ferredoxin domain-containing protein [Methanocorpusculum sp.]MDE2522502.1 ferredoxin domain-containing protein [Methanocorpusculum sp.]MDE2525088.1 ferredoxin domain-containing protein [Methanocorpusculum sp.]
MSAFHPGPNCIFKITNLGIATGSAVKCAASHNIDNRVMYTAGTAARRLGLMEDCTIVYGIPLKISGKKYFLCRDDDTLIRRT